MKFLAFDIGNSFTKIYIFNDSEITERFVFANSEISTFLKTDFYADKAAVSSVVPEVSEKIIDRINKNKIDYLIISKNSKLNYEIGYNQPGKLGTDRICGAAGIISLKKNKFILESDKLLYADLGTATTLNYIEKNTFLGGIIAPGMNTMAESLNNKTAQLPKTDFTEYSEIIGRTTDQAIASGIINSTAGLIERTYNSVFADNNIPIVLTGGNAKYIQKHLSVPSFLFQDLVAIGIKEIANLNL